MLIERPRRNRKSPAIRSLLQENRLHPSHFVAPLFLVDGVQQKQTINTLPNIYRYSLDLLLQECRYLNNEGVSSILLFPCFPFDVKDSTGSYALDRDNILHQAIGEIKARFPSLTVMVDVALDPYTDHGHDGLINESGYVLNDPTVAMLSEMAVALAESGADVVAPSDMMDGRVGAIRKALDSAGHSQVSILSYTAKYASAFYGPFRSAVQSCLKIGDKKNYQMDPANIREALRESALDVEEGADLLLVKPALAYLDVIAKIKQTTHLPVGAYHVSGEYAMLKAAEQLGCLNYTDALLESLISIKRAGADFIISYPIKDILCAL